MKHDVKNECKFSRCVYRNCCPEATIEKQTICQEFEQETEEDENVFEKERVKNKKESVWT